MQVKPILWVLFLFFSTAAWAQPSLDVMGTTPDLYLIHKVEAKETWYSIGRLYNLSPKDIAPFNKTDINAGLKVGQELKIPLNSTNFSQNERKGSGEVLVPLTYVVKEGEWMYRVSVNHNKVDIDKLEKWNGITRNDIRPGMALVVGFLKVNQAQSALASKAVSNTAGTVKTTPAPAPASTQPKAPIDPPKETGVATSTNPQRPVYSTPSSEPVNVDYSGGFFKTSFRSGSKTTNGQANVFRSTSGWKDGKYYALMDNVAVGSIVRVRHTATGKIIYAKVLGRLSDIKENSGLTIRVSNAAAAELGVGTGSDTKFSVEVSY